MRRVLGLLIIYAMACITNNVARAMTTSARPIQADLELDDKRKYEIATAVAEQVWREQQLTSYRMTWNLSFQGFLFAAFSFTFSNVTAIPSIPRCLLQVVIVIGGFSVGQATKHSIRASQFQRDFMKDIWKQFYPVDTLTSYPRPFSVNVESERGRRSATSIIKTILYMWATLGALAIFSAIGSNWELILIIIKRLQS